MPTSIKKAVVKAKVEDQIVELMLKSQVDNIFLEDGSTTLASKIADIITTLGTKADSTAVTQEINAAINGLIDGAPETYNTLREIAEYIESHEEVVTALNAAIGNKVDKVEGKGLSANDFTDILKAKLDAIAEGAEVNQNAFSKVKVGDTLVEATDKTDTVELVAGDNVTLTPDAEGKKVTVGVTIPEVVVDDELSDTSENSVQNKVVKAAIDSVQSAVDAKHDVYIQSTEPAEMKSNDIWLQIVEDAPANSEGE